MPSSSIKAGARMLRLYEKMLVSSDLRHSASIGANLESEYLRIPKKGDPADTTANFVDIVTDVLLHLADDGRDVSEVAEGIDEISDLPSASVRVFKDPVLLARHMVEDIRLRALQTGIDFDAVVRMATGHVRTAAPAI